MPLLFRANPLLSPEPLVDRCYQCLCCRDTGIIISANVQRYIMSDYQPYQEAIVCKRLGCSGFYVDVPYPDGSGSSLKPRYSFDIVLKPDDGMCDRIHQAEIQRLREFQSDVTESDISDRFDALLDSCGF